MRKFGAKSFSKRVAFPQKGQGHADGQEWPSADAGSPQLASASFTTALITNPPEPMTPRSLPSRSASGRLSFRGSESEAELRAEWLSDARREIEAER